MKKPAQHLIEEVPRRQARVEMTIGVDQNISSFALYGFKVKYLAAFTCAILNNQPMGFYSPAVLVKDAQRHGLRVKPIDVQTSDWP
jgi:error-prone DNA polymerase